MTVDQIDDEVLKLKKEQFNLRFQRATGQLENTSRVRVVRRDIARLKTIARQKRAGEPMPARCRSGRRAAKPKRAKPKPTAKAAGQGEAESKPKSKVQGEEVRGRDAEANAARRGGQRQAGQDGRRPRRAPLHASGHEEDGPAVEEVPRPRREERIQGRRPGADRGAQADLQAQALAGDLRREAGQDRSSDRSRTPRRSRNPGPRPRRSKRATRNGIRGAS